jgi:hypothetical protein
MKAYDSSSQTVFLPRQFSFSSANHTPHGHVFSSRGPALRAALASPSAVRPDGLLDHRDSYPDTTVVHGDASVDGKRATTSRWQDNAVLRTAPPASSQPAPGTNGERRSVSDTGSARSQNSADWLKRTSRLTLRVRPGVKTALLRIAKDDKVSLSEASATGLEVYARAAIHDQEETLFEPRMQAMMRREIRSSDDRHVPFEIKNAVAAEQTRIYTADMYRRVLLKEGFSQKEINKKLDAAYNLACDNVFNTKTPKFTALLQRYWAMTEEQPDRQTGKTGGSHTEPIDRGAAGKGKPNA